MSFLRAERLKRAFFVAAVVAGWAQTTESTFGKQELSG
jgi:hypothetical protein